MPREHAHENQRFATTPPVGAVFALALVGLMAMTAQGVCADGLPCHYEVEIVQHECAWPFPNSPTHGNGIASNGTVVGDYRDCVESEDHAMIWSPGGPMQTIPYPPGVNHMKANDISDASWVVGEMDGVEFSTKAFLHKEDGTILDLGYPAGGASSKAYGVAIDGTIVGEWYNSLGPSPRAFRWTAGMMTDITPLLGTAKGIAYDISADGSLVTGWAGETADYLDARAFVLDGEVAKLLPPIPGGLTSIGRAVNSQGEVAGNGRVGAAGAGGSWCAYAHLNGKPIALSELPGAGGSRANDLSDELIVGYSGSTMGTRAVVWTRDGQVHDLNDLIDPPFSLELREAIAISAAGVITGKGIASSGTVAVRLTPVWPSTGDLNCDQIVNGFDLALLLGYWGKCRTEACPADLSVDSVVNGVDLALLLSLWG